MGKGVSYKGIFTVALIVVLLIGLLYTKNNSKKALFILPEKDFDNYEFVNTRDILIDNDFDIALASTTIGEIIDDKNVVYESKYDIRDVDIDDYQIIILVGGNGTKLILDNQDIHNLLKDAYNNNKYIAAICYGPVVLARAGILKGHTAVVYPNPKHIKELQDSGALIGDSGVSVSKNIITAANPRDTIKFAETILGILK